MTNENYRSLKNNRKSTNKDKQAPIKNHYYQYNSKYQQTTYSQATFSDQQT